MTTRCNAIARKAMERKTGARGLRSIVEAVLLDTMYDLPSLKGVSKVVIDETVIEGRLRAPDDLRQARDSGRSLESNCLIFNHIKGLFAPFMFCTGSRAIESSSSAHRS